jgi:cytochrome c oxidase subunit III
MRERVALELGELPLHGRGSDSPTMWGTLAFMLLEGSAFALCIGIYLYLLVMAPAWPIGARPPRPWAGTIVTIILLVSLWPNYLVGRWARQQRLTKVRVGMVIMSVLGIAPLVVRVFEFRSLNVWWDTNAYGSVLWLLLGLHSTHLITDLADTLVLAVMMFTRHGRQSRRFGDVEDNVLYWNFVVITWLPVYFCVYWIPRL